MLKLRVVFISTNTQKDYIHIINNNICQTKAIKPRIDEIYMER